MRVSRPHGRSYANVACDDGERGLDVGFGRVGMADAAGSRARSPRRASAPRTRTPTCARRLRNVRSRTSWPSSVTRPAGHVLQAREQRRDGRLARAGRADERERLAGLDREVEAAQHAALPPGIREVHVVEAHVAACVQRALVAFGRSAMSGSVSNTSHTRPAAVSASSAIARIHASSSIGNTRISRYDTNATRPPTVMLPDDTASAPPRRTPASVRFGISPSTQMNCVWIAHPLELGLAELRQPLVVAAEHLVAPPEGLDDADAARRLLRSSVVRSPVWSWISRTTTWYLRSKRRHSINTGTAVEIVSSPSHTLRCSSSAKIASTSTMMMNEEDRAERGEAPDQRDVGVRAREKLARLPTVVEADLEPLEVLVEVVAQIGLDARRDPRRASAGGST